MQYTNWTLNPDVTWLETYSGKKTILYHRPLRKEFEINQLSLTIIKLFLKGLSTERIAGILSARKGQDMTVFLTNLVQDLAASGLMIPDNGPAYPYPLRKVPHSTLHLADIQIEIIKGCNLRCKHCYMSAPEFSAAKDMQPIAFETFAETMRQAADLGTRVISITGGEPLMHPDIRAMITLIRDLGMETILFTNGTLITEDLADWLADMHLHEARISLDGLVQATHDELRGVKGSYTRAIRGARRLHDRGIPLHTTITGHNKNLNEVPGLIEFIRKDLEAQFTIDSVVPIGIASYDKNMVVHPDDFGKLVAPYLTQADDLPTDSRINMAEVPVENREYFCGAGNSYIFIDSDGKVRACPTMYAEAHTGGYIQNQSLQDIWLNSENFQAIRYMNCRHIESCAVADICKGGCRSRALTMFGELDAPDYYQCAAYGLELPDEIKLQFENQATQSQFIALDSIA